MNHAAHFHFWYQLAQGSVEVRVSVFSELVSLWEMWLSSQMNVEMGAVVGALVEAEDRSELLHDNEWAHVESTGRSESLVVEFRHCSFSEDGNSNNRNSNTNDG